MTERKNSDPYMNLSSGTSLETILRKHSGYAKKVTTYIHSAASSDDGSMEVQWGGNTPSPSHESLTLIHSDEVQDENDVFSTGINSGIGNTRPGIVFNVDSDATNPNSNEIIEPRTKEITGTTADASEKDDPSHARDAYPTLQLRGARLAAMAESSDSNQKDQEQDQEQLPQLVGSNVGDNGENNGQQPAVISTHNDDDEGERRASEPRMKVGRHYD